MGEGLKRMRYRKLKGYKYELLDPIETPVVGLPDVITEYIKIETGVLYINSRYAWDGPSGPTIDTPNFMRSSLVHDALYQLMREGHIDRKKYRKYADKLLQQISIADGMSKFRANYIYLAVRLFAKQSSTPRKNPRGKIITLWCIIGIN